MSYIINVSVLWPLCYKNVNILVFFVVKLSSNIIDLFGDNLFVLLAFSINYTVIQSLLYLPYIISETSFNINP